MNTITISVNWYSMHSNKHAIVRKFLKDWAIKIHPASIASENILFEYMSTFGKEHRIRINWDRHENMVHLEIPEDRLILLELKYCDNY